MSVNHRMGAKNRCRKSVMQRSLLKGYGRDTDGVLKIILYS